MGEVNLLNGGRVMKSRKLVSLLTATTVAAGMLVGCGSTETAETTAAEATTAAGTTAAEAAPESEEPAASGEPVEISILTSKADIVPFFEPALEQYAIDNNLIINFEAVGEGQSPYQAMQVKYASGEAPTLALVDCNDIVALGEEHGVPLDDEKWVADGGNTYGVSVNGTLYGFPFSLEGRGILFNRTAIETTLGRDFDETAITNIDEFSALCDELVAAGMEKPVIITKEDWSLGAHYMGLMYEQQDGTEEGAQAFVDGLKAGDDVAANERFNSLMDTFDVLKKYNINGEDPMAVDYDLDNANFAVGDAAFWFNGNWVWPVVSTFADESAEFGMMPTFQAEGDQFNTLVNAVGSKQFMIDNSASEAQIQAAKDLLNWMVYDEGAHFVMAEEIQSVPSFTTYQASEANKIGIPLKEYADAGNTFPQYNGLPGDHWAEVGRFMQKYLASESTEADRAELATSINEYWTSQE